MSARPESNTIQYILGSAELHRKDLRRTRMTTLESNADFRKLDAYNAELDEVVRAPDEFDRAVVQNPRQIDKDSVTASGVKDDGPDDVACEVNLPREPMLDELGGRLVRLAEIPAGVLVSADGWYDACVK